jgi:hypothetical protein
MNNHLSPKTIEHKRKTETLAAGNVPYLCNWCVLRRIKFMWIILNWFFYPFYGMYGKTTENRLRHFIHMILCAVTLRNFLSTKNKVCKQMSNKTHDHFWFIDLIYIWEEIFNIFPDLNSSEFFLFAYLEILFCYWLKVLFSFYTSINCLAGTTSVSKTNNMATILSCWIIKFNI